MKKFALVTGIAGIVCIVLGVIVITAAAAAGADLSGPIRRGHLHFHEIFDSRAVGEIMEEASEIPGLSGLEIHMDW